MNATSFVRPLCRILGAPLMLFALAAAVPADADGADLTPVAVPVAKKAPDKKSFRDQTGDRGKKKSSLGKHTKKQHKQHKQKKHGKKGKNAKNGQKNGQQNGQKNGRTSSNGEAANNVARADHNEAGRGRDANQLKRALR